jgi:hypothetical protein
LAVQYLPITRTPTKNETNSANWPCSALHRSPASPASLMAGTPIPTTMRVSAMANTASVKNATRS